MNKYQKALDNLVEKAERKVLTDEKRNERKDNTDSWTNQRMYRIIKNIRW